MSENDFSYTLFFFSSFPRLMQSFAFCFLCSTQAIRQPLAARPPPSSRSCVRPFGSFIHTVHYCLLPCCLPAPVCPLFGLHACLHALPFKPPSVRAPFQRVCACIAAKLMESLCIKRKRDERRKSSITQCLFLMPMAHCQPTPRRPRPVVAEQADSAC